MTRRRALTALCAALFALATYAATPPVDDVGFAPSVGAPLPLDARFVDEHGRQVHLGDYLTERTAIVVPAYYGCSNLCTAVVEGLAASLAAAQWNAGRDVEIVVASISAADTPAAALAKKRAVLGLPDASGWHFLTGDERAIGQLTAALGYRYAYDEATRQYAHAAGIVVVAPGGRVARTLYGVSFSPAALREASAAEPEAPAHWLLCFRFDPHTGRYTFAALQAVRLAALASLVAVAVFVIRAYRRERRADS
jgi:protein SCO1/2